MSDRLREAADRLALCVVATAADMALDNPPRDAEPQVVALLRAVAAWHTSDSDGEVCINCQMIWPCTQARTALDLADTILGVGDE